MGNYNWSEDIAIEDKRESSYKYIIEHLLATNCNNFSKESNYDVILADGTKVEIKVDDKAGTTGNIAIEYQGNWQQDSGLNSTEADQWLHFVAIDKGYDLYLFNVDELKAFIETNKEYVKSNGTGYSTRFYLIPIKLIEKYKVGSIRVENHIVRELTLLNNIRYFF